MSAASASQGTGLLIRYPCIWSHCNCPRIDACCSVSTPSAITLMSMAWPSETIVDTTVLTPGMHDIGYDTLVLAVGSQTNDFGTPGVREHAIALETPADAEQFHRRLVNACIRAHEFALIGMDAISDSRRAAEVKARLEESGRAVVSLRNAQLEQFAGNAIELSGRDGRILALSQRAFECLTGEQKTLVEQYARLVPFAVPTIEMAGGSVRCMVAGIHLSPRS
jgi:hypothetical protein